MRVYLALTRLDASEWGKGPWPRMQRCIQEQCATREHGMYSHVSLYFEGRTLIEMQMVPLGERFALPEARYDANVFFDVLSTGFTGFSTFMAEESWYRKYTSARVELYEIKDGRLTAQVLYARAVDYSKNPMAYNDNWKCTAALTPGCPGAWCSPECLCPCFASGVPDEDTTNCVGGTLVVMASAIDPGAMENKDLVLPALGLAGAAPGPENLLPSRALAALQKLGVVGSHHVAVLTNRHPYRVPELQTSAPLPLVLVS